MVRLAQNGKSHARGISTAGSKGKRNPSIDAASIGSPITSTFRQVEGATSTRVAGLVNGSSSSPRSPTYDALMHAQLHGQPQGPAGVEVGEGRGRALPSPPITGMSIASVNSGVSGGSTELPYRSPPRSNPHADGILEGTTASKVSLTPPKSVSPDQTGRSSSDSSETVEIKRKPVPDLSHTHQVREGAGAGAGVVVPSESFSSSKSFVLEDPPRRRR